MAKIPLTEGFYEARSLIADAQSCVNLFPEVNPKDAEQPVTLYPTPGLITLSTTAIASPCGGPLYGWRGLYLASNDAVYGVLGNTLYQIPSNFTPVFVGTLNPAPGIGTQVDMKDNGTTLIVVDGSHGYQVTLQTNTFSQIADPNFLGGTHVDYLDTFLLTNIPNTQSFQSTHSNSTTWDPLFVAAKTGEPDKLRALNVVHREIWLFGETSTEVWYNVGGATFPFAILPGIFIQQGIAAVHSLAYYDLMNFWLGQNESGQYIVYMSRTYQANRISTHAIEKEIASYPTATDAIGFCYQQEGHVFYVLHFPSGNKTWVFDMSSQKWHQRAWFNTQTGTNQMWRPSSIINAFGIALGGDWQNGNLYKVDLNTYTDFGGPIVREKSFPHIINDGKRVHYTQFSADMEAGGQDPTIQVPAWISLSWSDDRGESYGSPILQDLGSGGNYRVQPKWNRLGMARDRVFKLTWSINARTALSGAYLDAVPFGS